ncbi:MAG: CARDB domain-containing protein [Bacillota bacterium]
MLTFVTILASSPAIAGEVHTFGYTDERQRVVEDQSCLPMVPSWYADVGKSYSQPLVLDGSRFGGDRPVVVMMAGNYLWAIRDMQGDGSENNNVLFQKDIPGGYGSEVSASHTTFYKTSEGKELLFSGTNDGRLLVHDLGGNKVFGMVLGKRIVSAPLVTEWKGHLLAVVGSDDGNAYVVTNFNDIKPKAIPFYVGGVITSSPAPLDNEGFIISSDGAGGKVVAFRYGDNLRETADGGLEAISGKNRLWYIDSSMTPLAGVPASFSVDRQQLYFSDKNGRMFQVDKKTGELLHVNTGLSGGGTFTNRSPAVGDSIVVFPVRNLHGSGKGALAVLDKADMSLKYLLEAESQVVTAPVIWPSANVLAVGEQNGYLGVWSMSDWKTSGRMKVTNPPAHDGRATSSEGVCAEISVGNGLLLVAGSDVNSSHGGILRAMKLSGPLDLAVTDLKSGVAGEKAESGKEYTGRVTFKNTGKARLSRPAAVKVTHNGYEAVLKDEQGREVKTLDLAPGEEKTLSFIWHGPDGTGKSILKAVINIPPDEALWETDYTNNEKTLVVPVLIRNLRVGITNYPEKVTEGDEATVAARVFNWAGEMITTKVVWKVNGKVVREIPAFNLISRADSAVVFKMPSTEARVTVEVNPDRNAPPDETTYKDNTDSCVIKPEPRIKQANAKLEIIAPKSVPGKEFNKPGKGWDFTVKITTYIPKPPEGSDAPPPEIYVSVSGSSQLSGGYRLENDLYGNVINLDVKDVSFSRGVKYTAGYGEYVKEFKFTFPFSGLYGRDTTARISAGAACWYYSIDLKAKDTVKIEGMEYRNPQVHITR